MDARRQTARESPPSLTTRGLLVAIRIKHIKRKLFCATRALWWRPKSGRKKPEELSFLGSIGSAYV